MKTKQLVLFINYDEETGLIISSCLQGEYSAPQTLQTPQQIHYHDITIDLSTHKTFVENSEIILTMTEFKMLTALISKQGQALSFQEALEEVWGSCTINEMKLVSNCISRLRSKIGFDRIENIRGFGYRIA